MAYTRRNVGSDATWQRAWTADAFVDLATLQTAGLPRRGDFAYVTATSTWYIWLDNGTWFALTAAAAGAGQPGPPGWDGQDADPEPFFYTPPAAGGGPAGSPVTTLVARTDTGAVNNWAPALSGGETFIEWAGTADATFSGLAGGTSALQLVIVKNTGSHNAFFLHNSGLSSAGNKFQNMVTSGPTPVGPSGYIVFQYDGTNWQLLDHEQGSWIQVPFLAGNYTPFGVGTWTVISTNVVAHHYFVRGKTISVLFNINFTTTSGCTSGFLLVPIPGLYTMATTSFAFLDWQQNSVPSAGFGSIQMNTDGNVYFKKSDNSAFVDSSSTALRGSVLGSIT